jgi:hypothetical protein
MSKRSRAASAGLAIMMGAIALGDPSAVTARGPSTHTTYPFLKPLAPVRVPPRITYPPPVLPFEAEQPVPELPPTETRAQAIAEAYASNPALGERRYELRATDENLAQAYAELRPTTELQISGGYHKTVPGRTTQASRPLADRLDSATIKRNDLGAQLIINQPLSTGGRASADIASARADILAGRQALRGAEGDILLQVITANLDVRRDLQILGIRQTNVRVLEATLAEAIIVASTSVPVLTVVALALSCAVTV